MAKGETSVGTFHYRQADRHKRHTDVAKGVGTFHHHQADRHQSPQMWQRVKRLWLPSTTIRQTGISISVTQMWQRVWIPSTTIRQTGIRGNIFNSYLTRSQLSTPGDSYIGLVQIILLQYCNNLLLHHTSFRMAILLLII